jgi:tetratricopeptide (TPR) repeat protein
MRSYVPGEKPVVNERFQPYHYPVSGDTGKKKNAAKPAQLEAKPAQPEAAPPEIILPTEKTPKITQDNKFKEGKRLFDQKHWEQALKEFLDVNAANFNDDERVELAYYLGLCCAKLERFDDALLYLEQVVTAGNDVLRVYQCRMTVAYIYVITARPKMAEFELKRLQSAGFESAPLYNTLAYASYTQKRYRRAIEFYEKTLDIDRNNATALNSMGFILADTGLDPSKGLRFCRKAVDLNPQNAAYLDSLGWAHYKCGDILDARNWLRRAVELAPKVKEINEHLKTVNKGAV